MNDPFRAEPFGVGVALLFIASILSGGCSAGQAVLSAQAQVILDTQPSRFAAYESAHDDCLGSSESSHAYQDCMALSRHVARAADSYASSLQAAQAALNASGEESFRAMLPCLVSSAAALMDALIDANVPVPDEVSEIVHMAGAFSGSCEQSNE